MTNIQPLPQYHDLRVDPFMSQEGWQRPFCAQMWELPPPFFPVLSLSLSGHSGKGGYAGP